MDFLPLVLGILLAATHLAASRFRFLDRSPRTRWLSFAGGVSAAYVFLHILPALRDLQRSLENAEEGWLSYLDQHAYLLALTGMAIFYGLEHAVTRRRSEEEAIEGDAIFWVHVGAFACYNALIAYLLVKSGLRWRARTAVVFQRHGAALCGQ